MEGDVFGELLELRSSSDPRETADEAARVGADAESNKVFVVHGHDHGLKIELEVFLSRIGLTPIVLHR